MYLFISNAIDALLFRWDTARSVRIIWQ